MLFQWISIHTGLRTWKHKINQRFWALGVPWSPGFVLGLPLEVVLKNNPSDHETWSIRCHVGIQVDFTSILHSHTPLVPQAECEVNLDRLHLLHQWECSKSKGRGLSVSCVKWPSHSHRCPNMVYFFVPFLCDYSLDLFNVVVCFVPLQPQDPENVAPTFFYLFVELERSMWPMRSCGFPYFCRSISSEPFLRKIIGLPDGLKGGGSRKSPFVTRIGIDLFLFTIFYVAHGPRQAYDQHRNIGPSKSNGLKIHQPPTYQECVEMCTWLQCGGKLTNIVVVTTWIDTNI